jgi:hypothetical protein
MVNPRIGGFPLGQGEYLAGHLVQTARNGRIVGADGEPSQVTRQGFEGGCDIVHCRISHKGDRPRWCGSECQVAALTWINPTVAPALLDSLPTGS